MRAMVLTRLCDLREEREPLTMQAVPVPTPRPTEVLVRVSACGVCHTELDEIEGRLAPASLPIIPGHQIVGTVEESGENVRRLRRGDRVGIAWIHSACGECRYCRQGMENLCAEFRATGRDVNGGYAECVTVPEDFAHPLPAEFTDVQAAPLLCAGAIGYRSIRLAGLVDGQTLGLTGFGASGHLVLKMVRHRYPHVEVVVFARSELERTFALELGATWAGDTRDVPPRRLDAVIDTTPVWTPVVEGLRHLSPGGRLVINAIRKEEADKTALLSLSYPEHLWLEKEIKSVANVTRADVREFLQLAAEIPLVPETQEYPLAEANTALLELKRGEIRGAKVLRMA